MLVAAGGYDVVGGLLVMVMFSGYENFDSQPDISENKREAELPGNGCNVVVNRSSVDCGNFFSTTSLRVLDAKNVPDKQTDVVRHYPSDVCALCTKRRTKTDYFALREVTVGFA